MDAKTKEYCDDIIRRFRNNLSDSTVTTRRIRTAHSMIVANGLPYEQSIKVQCRLRAKTSRYLYTRDRYGEASLVARTGMYLTITAIRFSSIGVFLITDHPKVEWELRPSEVTIIKGFEMKR